MFTLAEVPKIGQKGKLSGDRLLIEQATDDARALESRPVGFPEGPQTNQNHLASPLSAAWIMGELFEPAAIRVSGKRTRWPGIPPGAICDCR